MIDNEKLAYDLALIYARSKFEVANSKGIFGMMSPDNEPEAEVKALAVFFNEAYNQLISYDLSEVTES